MGVISDICRGHYHIRCTVIDNHGQVLEHINWYEVTVSVIFEVQQSPLYKRVREFNPSYNFQANLITSCRVQVGISICCWKRCSLDQTCNRGFPLQSWTRCKKILKTIELFSHWRSNVVFNWWVMYYPCCLFLSKTTHILVILVQLWLWAAVIALHGLNKTLEFWRGVQQCQPILC